VHTSIPDIRPRQRRSRGLVVAIAIGMLVLVLARALPGTYVEYLWYGEVGFRQVFLALLWNGLGLQLAFGGVALVFFLGNVLAAIRQMPPRVMSLHEPRIPELPYERIRPALRALAVLAGAGFALLVATWARGLVMPWLTFRHAQPFGVSDPVFHHDLATYVYVLPFVSTIVGFALLTLVVTLVATAAAYVLHGQVGLRPDERVFVGHPVRRHLSVLLGVGLLLVAALDLLGRYTLLQSSTGIVNGAGYSDLHATLPGLTIAAVLSALSALVIVVDGFRTWTRVTPVTIAVVVLGHMVLVQVWPAAMQRLVVTPNELNRERPYLEREIAATRHAYGLDRVEEGRFPATTNLSAARVAENARTIDNVRLWEGGPLKRTNAQLQEIRTYYDFVDVDNDRYVLGGELQQVALSTRELNPAALPARIWINEHLTYTHGYGVCVAPVNRISPEGLPEYFVKDIPPVSSKPELNIRRPEIYYGELAARYVFVNTAAHEFDYPSGDENAYTHYQGKGGLPLGGLGGRLLFALRYGEPKILLSTDLVPGTRILIHRTVLDRIARIAPYLQWDGDPYIVIRADGRLTWMLDGYTTSDRIPYSAPTPRLGNYIRNSVKATVDAYDGTVRLWAVDPGDPLLRTYEKIFPGAYAPLDSMPADLQAHMRYPQRLFATQAQVYATYHMSDPQTFYNKEDLWRVARRDDGSSVVPYYTVMKLAGVGEREEYILMLPFTPARKENMIAWMSARCDPPNYGKLLVYAFPKQRLVYGPQQIESRINQDTDISKELTLWNQQGSEVIRGNLLVVPVDSSLIYFQPLYLQAQGEAGLPELKRVMVAFGDRLAMEPSMSAALARVFGPGARSGEDAESRAPAAAQSPGAGPPGDAAARLQRAAEIYDRAQQALRRGDLQEYAKLMEALGGVIREKH
jgi:uncharacterized membrane protein (UPF0182 family)